MADGETSEQAKLREAYQGKNCAGPSPFAKAGILSHLSFRWLNPMLEVAVKVPLTQQMHYELRDSEKCLNVADRMEKIWYQIYPRGHLPPGTKTPVGGLFRMIWRTFSWTIGLSLLSMFLITASTFFNTYVVYLAINQVSQIDYSKPLRDNQAELTLLAYYCSAFVALRVLNAVAFSYVGFRMSLAGMNIANGLNIQLFKKMMRRSLERDTTFELGDITNLSQVDTQSFANLFRMGSWVIQTPLNIIFGLGGLIFLMGSAAIYTFGIVIVVMVLNYYFTMLYQINKVGYMRVSDLRGKLTNEIFKNIRYIKMVGLESYFLSKLKRLRDFELFWIKKQNLRFVAMSFNNDYGTGLYIVAMYTIKIVQTGRLDLDSAFISAMIFATFNTSLRVLGPFVVFIMDAIVSARRICFFMLSEELDLSYLKRTLPDKQTATNMTTEGEIVLNPKPEKVSFDGDRHSIVIRNGNFYWVDLFTKEFYKKEKQRISKKNLDAEEKIQQKKWMSVASEATLAANLLEDEIKESFKLLRAELPQNRLVLQDISLQIPQGACVAIIGKVGSGKSSILSALAGEMYVEKDTEVMIDGSISYVSQKPWITSNTVKDVILFGKPFDEKRFQDAIRFSCMEDDLKLMDNGADTLLGDRGVNLSGGQKTRLAIARALYSNSDLYLLDDPISALDIHVGKKVMEEGFLHYLKGKTRIIATHALAYLPYFDFILMMDDGKIVEQGTYEQVTRSALFMEIKKGLEKDEENPEEIDEVGISEETAEVIRRKSSRKSNNPEEKEARSRVPEIDIGEADTQADKVIEHIVSSEDRVKGDVITWALIKKYIYYCGGSGFAIVAIVCKHLLI